MTLAATSYVAVAESNLANLLARSAAFRAVPGISAANAAAALAYIHAPIALDRVVDGGAASEPWPRALIGPCAAGGLKKRGPGDWWDYGILHISFQFLVPVAYITSPLDSLRWFTNTYGEILKEMMIDSFTGPDKLSVQEFEPFNAPDTHDPDHDLLSEGLSEDAVELFGAQPLGYEVIYLVHY